MKPVTSVRLDEKSEMILNKYMDLYPAMSRTTLINLAIQAFEKSQVIRVEFPEVDEVQNKTSKLISKRMKTLEKLK